MKKLVFLFFVFVQVTLFAQSDRFQILEQRLNDLSSLNPGLNEKVDFSVSGVSIQEFLRGLAEANNLNISVDPNLSIKIYNNFTNEKVANILLFLAKEYNLDIRFVGSIMSIYQYSAPVDIPKYVPKELGVKFNSYNNTLTLDLQRDTLEKVVKKITQVTKRNVVFGAGLENNLISVYLEDLPVEKALEQMALVNNLKLFKNEDNIFYLQKIGEDEKKDMESTTFSSGPKTNRKLGGVKKGGTASGNVSLFVLDTLGRKLITLEALNAPIADVVQSVAQEVGINYFLYSAIQGNTTIRITDQSFDGFLTYILQGTNYTFKVEEKLYLIGERKLEGLRANKVFQFKFRSLETIQDVIPAELKNGVEVKEFKELNSILLSGSLPQINEIMAYMRELDRVVPQVLIELILVNVQKGKNISTGIRAGLADSIKTGGTILPGVDFTFSSRSLNNLLSKIGTNTVNLGRVTPDFYVGLSALEENNTINVRSMPKLATLNGHEASLSIGSKRYYSIKTQNVLGSLNTQTVVTEQFNSVEANLSINIKPVISGDDQVTLNIDVNISDFLETPSNAPPPTSTSQFKSIIRVKNEEMVVLGGIEKTESAESGSGVPVLSRIPVLKWFFSSRKKSKNKTIYTVFIKPTIIY